MVNQDTSANRPFIVGLSKNNCKIRVYIDNKYNGEFIIKNHPSGTADFAYKPKSALSRGGHSVYTVAIDQRGKESIKSNKIVFVARNSAIAESAQEEKIAGQNDLKPSMGAGQTDRPEQRAGEPDNTVDKIKVGGGIINEGKENQVSLKLGVVLFILFLIGITACLIWVNRELVKDKERQALGQAKPDKRNHPPSDRQ